MPAPIKCYYLLENTDKPEHTTVIVSDEPEQVAFQLFSRTTDTPPSTPMTSQPRLGANDVAHTLSYGGHEENELSVPGGIPDLNVIRPTPTSTPHHTPPGSTHDSDSEGSTPPRRRSPPGYFQGHKPEEGTSADFTHAASCPMFSGGSLRPSSPEEVEQYLYHQGAGSPPEHYQTPPYISVMRTSSASIRTSSMSPLKEDVNEEEESEFSAAIIADEGIVMRKISDVSNISVSSTNGAEPAEASASSSKQPVRRISDVSDHSGESGIESTTSKVSDASKESLPPDRENCKQSTSSERKLSDSSVGSAEDELTLIRMNRAGSVSKTIEKYDSLTRFRRSGLPTVVHPVPNHPAEGTSWRSKERSSLSPPAPSLSGTKPGPSGERISPPPEKHHLTNCESLQTSSSSSSV